jgi:hypothetical protein
VVSGEIWLVIQGRERSVMVNLVSSWLLRIYSWMTGRVESAIYVAVQHIQKLLVKLDLGFKLLILPTT